LENSLIYQFFNLNTSGSFKKRNKTGALIFLLPVDNHFHLTFGGLSFDPELILYNIKSSFPTILAWLFNKAKNQEKKPLFGGYKQK
jgi:hypothetical protein